VKCGDGHHYHLDFTFSPSRAFFDQPLELKIQGKYVESDCHVWLYDEDGEEVESKPQRDNKKIVFKIDHFSSYSYDFYER